MNSNIGIMKWQLNLLLGGCGTVSSLNYCLSLSLFDSICPPAVMYLGCCQHLLGEGEGGLEEDATSACMKQVAAMGG